MSDTNVISKQLQLFQFVEQWRSQVFKIFIISKLSKLLLFKMIKKDGRKRKPDTNKNKQIVFNIVF